MNQFFTNFQPELLDNATVCNLQNKLTYFRMKRCFYTCKTNWLTFTWNNVIKLPKQNGLTFAGNNAIVRKLLDLEEPVQDVLLLLLRLPSVLRANQFLYQRKKKLLNFKAKTLFYQNWILHGKSKLHYFYNGLHS